MILVLVRLIDVMGLQNLQGKWLSLGWTGLDRRREDWDSAFERALQV